MNKRAAPDWIALVSLVGTLLILIVLAYVASLGIISPDGFVVGAGTFLLAMATFYLASTEIAESRENRRQDRDLAERTLKEDKIRRHSLRLVDKPLNALEQRLLPYDAILGIIVDLSKGELRGRKIKIYGQSRAENCLCEHLENGYPEIWKAIQDYKDSYNGIFNRVLKTHKRGMDLLVQKWDAETNLKTVKPLRKRALIIRDFNAEVVNRLFQGYEPNLPCVKNLIEVWYGSILLSAENESEANRIVDDLNSILESPEIYGELQNLWEEAKFLREERNKIVYELKSLRFSVAEWVHLEGFCTVGIDAHYESSARSKDVSS